MPALHTAELPTMQASLGLFIEIAQDNLARAIAHIATVEGRPTSEEDYLEQVERNNEAVSEILDLSLHDNEYFAVIGSGTVRAADLRDPVINPNPRARSSHRLRIGWSTTLISEYADPRTKKGGIFVSASDFVGAATTAEAAEEALLNLAERRKPAAVLAGREALSVLGPDTNIMRIMAAQKLAQKRYARV